MGTKTSLVLSDEMTTKGLQLVNEAKWLTSQPLLQKLPHPPYLNTHHTLEGTGGYDTRFMFTWTLASPELHDVRVC